MKHLLLMSTLSLVATAAMATNAPAKISQQPGLTVLDSPAPEAVCKYRGTLGCHVYEVQVSPGQPDKFIEIANQTTPAISSEDLTGTTVHLPSPFENINLQFNHLHMRSRVDGKRMPHLQSFFWNEEGLIAPQASKSVNIDVEGAKAGSTVTLYGLTKVETLNKYLYYSCSLQFVD